MNRLILNVILPFVIAASANMAVAGDDFAILENVSAQKMSQTEMQNVVGAFLINQVSCTTCGDSFSDTTQLQLVEFDNGAVGPCFHGVSDPHPAFPGTPNPSGKFIGWAAGL